MERAVRERSTDECENSAQGRRGAQGAFHLVTSWDNEVAGGLTAGTGRVCLSWPAGLCRGQQDGPA